MGGKPTVARQVKAEFDVYAFLSRWARTVLQLAIVAFVLSLGYILFGIFSGALVKSDADVPKLVANMRLMGQLMAVAGTLGTLAFVVLTISELAFAILAGIVGAGLLFGMPILVASNLARADAAFATTINEWSKNRSMGILAILALRNL